MSKEVLEIKNENDVFLTLEKRLRHLVDALGMIVHDYHHHLEEAGQGNIALNEFVNDIQYRISSADFHFQILLQSKMKVEMALTEYFELNHKQSGFHSAVFLEKSKEQIDALIDSIVFHLGSSFDYLSRIIFYIVDSKNQGGNKWNQLYKASQDEATIFNEHKDLVQSIINEHKSLVNPLFSYRSRVIHKKSEKSTTRIWRGIDDQKWNIHFFAARGLIKEFYSLRHMSKKYDLTPTYCVSWLILSTINSISRIILKLKTEMERMSTFPSHLKKSYFLVAIDPDTGRSEPISNPVWKRLQEQMEEDFDI